MKENNYSSIEKYEDRFGYKESGAFYCGSKYEYLLYALCVCALVIGIIVIDAKILEPALYQTSMALFFALASLIVCSVWGAIWVVLAKLVMSGFKCRYECDRERFTTTVGSKTRTIYYKEVLGVYYDEMTLFGKTRGYNVTVRTLNGTIKYRLVFPNSHAVTNPRNTVFNIIDERARNLRKPQQPEVVPAAERYIEEAMKPGDRSTSNAPLVGAVFPAERRDNIPENAEMPTVSLSSQSVLARLEAELSDNDPHEAAPAAGLSPTAEQLRRDREEAAKDALIAKGRMQLRQKMAFPLAAAIVAVLVAIVFCAVCYFPDLLAALPELALLVAAVFLFGGTFAAVMILTGGREFGYRATGREFVISDRKGREVMTFYYSDVLRVDYKEQKLLWKTIGYDVTVTTKYRAVLYRWLFPHRMTYCTFGKTPFQIIIDNCPPFEPLPDNKKRKTERMK
ncbi:MAG: hypothetical protein ACI4XA_07120 [Oscillospiraceae bacterium]